MPSSEKRHTGINPADVDQHARQNAKLVESRPVPNHRVIGTCAARYILIVAGLMHCIARLSKSSRVRTAAMAALLSRCNP